MANVYDKLLNDTFNALNPSVAEMYAGIYPPASSTSTPSYQSGMLGRGQPSSVGSSNLTTAEQQLLQQQIQQSQALQAGYNLNGTPKPIAPAVGVPTAAMPSVTPASWNSLDQAAYDAGNKPGTWMAQSRMQAQALMRQMAMQQAAGGVPGSPRRAPSLLDLVGGGNRPAGSPQTAAQPGGGLLALIAQSRASQPYGGRYTPQELAARTAQGIATGDKNRQNSAGNTVRDVAGNDMSSMSTNHQNSVRWQTGY